jgi:hypothetical protein
VARERSRIDDAFSAVKSKLIESFRSKYKDIFDASNIEPTLVGLATELVNEDSIDAAAQAGNDAMPDDATKPATTNVTAIVVGKVRKYAKKFPKRMADDISAAAYAAENEANAQGLEDDARVAYVLNAIDAKAEAFRSDAQMYAAPSWTAGNQQYGTALEANAVMLDWVVADNPCDVCAVMPEGNPYTMAALPMFPGDPHPGCLCSVTPDDVSWEARFGQAAA